MTILDGTKVHSINIGIKAHTKKMKHLSRGISNARNQSENSILVVVQELGSKFGTFA